MIASLTRLVGWGFFPLALLAKLPFAMSVVAVLTSVSVVTGSYAQAGLAAALVGVGTMLSGPVYGMLADRSGQRPVLVLTAVGNAAGLVSLAVVLALTGPEAPLTTPTTAAAVPLSFGSNPLLVYAAAFLIGATQPQASSMVRTRWLQALRHTYPNGAPPKMTSTVLSYESMTDELVFVLGPVLVGAVALLAGVVFPLHAAAVLTLVGVVGFAFHPSARFSPGRVALSAAEVPPATPTAPTSGAENTAPAAYIADVASEDAAVTGARTHDSTRMETDPFGAVDLPTQPTTPAEDGSTGRPGAPSRSGTPTQPSAAPTQNSAPSRSGAPSQNASPSQSSATYDLAPVSALVSVRVLVPVFGMLAIGLFFGAMLTSLTGFMETLGMADSTGLFYGVMGVTSALFAFAVVALPERFSFAARWLLAAGVAVSGSVVLCVDAGLPSLIVALLIQGTGIGPALVTLYSIAAQLAPAGRTTALMSMMATAVTVGQAGSSAVTGAIVDASSYGYAYFVVFGSTSLLLVLALAHVATRRRAGGL